MLPEEFSMKKWSIKIFATVAVVLVILGALIYLLTAGASVPQTVEQDPSLPHVTINNVTFHAETFGDPNNPVVIALHGGPGDDYKSLLSLKGLSDEYFVVFYDQRGTGLSPRVGADELTFDLTVSDLDLIVDHFSQGRKVNLVGHSFGAMVVSPYIGKFPEKVDHAVLSEAGFLTKETAMMYMGYFQGKTSNLPFSYRIHKFRSWLESLHINGSDDQARADYLRDRLSVGADGRSMQSERYCNGEYATKERKHWRGGALADKSIQDLSGKSEWVSIDSDGIPDFNFVKGVEDFPNDVLFIASECNTIFGEKVQRIHMRSFPNAKLAIIDDAGHDLFAGKPDETVGVIREYLKE
jgi:proline iminopeptidase